MKTRRLLSRKVGGEARVGSHKVVKKLTWIANFEGCFHIPDIRLNLISRLILANRGTRIISVKGFGS